HGAGAAHALAAGAAEGQGRIDVVLDPDQRVENHRAAVAGVDIVGVDARVVAIIRVETIDAIFAHLVCRGRARPGLAFSDPGVLGESELDHVSFRVRSRACGPARVWPCDDRDRLPGQAWGRTTMRGLRPEKGLETPFPIRRSARGQRTK